MFRGGDVHKQAWDVLLRTPEQMGYSFYNGQECVSSNHHHKGILILHSILYLIIGVLCRIMGLVTSLPGGTCSLKRSSDILKAIYM